MGADDIEAALPSSSLSKLHGLQTTLWMTNMHCGSCVSHVKDILSPFPVDVSVSLLDNQVIISHESDVTTEDIVGAFSNDDSLEVFHARTVNQDGHLVSDRDLSERNTSTWLDRGPLVIGDTPVAHENGKAKGNAAINAEHLRYCTECQQDKTNSGIDDSQPRQVPEGYDEESQISVGKEKKPSMIDDTPCMDNFELQVSITGMTCTACSSGIEGGLEDLPYVKSVNVSSLTHSGTIIFESINKDKETVVQKIVNCIEDMGFDARADSLAPQASRGMDKLVVANLSITGMTCNTCVDTVTRELQGLPYVKKVAVNLSEKSAQVIFDKQNHVDDITDRIASLGFNASIVGMKTFQELEKESVPKENFQRTVSIKIDGMFCRHCPENVVNTLRALSTDSPVEVTRKPTLANPIVDVTYTPATLTVRTLIKKIQESNSHLKAAVYHPQSVGDRSPDIQRREMKRYLIRLVFAFINAIPTFIIGIVFMSAVPSTNHVRRYFDEPMWSGQATRREWALLITSTPVMIFGADVFHLRAFKEVRFLWRPKSRVPFLRRFYRFGSMNLLISAGTLVAYISSLAILIKQASTKHTASGQHIESYFDTVVFLTFFILMGRSLEAYSKTKTGDTVAALGKLRSPEALLLVNKDGRTNIERINADLLEKNDHVIVPPGSSPPADGLVTGPDGSQPSDPTQFSYSFDESSLTGESRPVIKSINDKVYSGTVNKSPHPVCILVSDLGGTSLLDQIVSVVQEGQTKRAPVERIAETLTAYFVPIITLIAVVTFIIWQSLGLSGALPPDYYDMSSTLHPSQGEWVFWALNFAIAVFVVACPCGIGLAAPTALLVGSGMAAKLGILVQGGGEAFQEASQLDAIVFDKTGTLTEGGQMDVSVHNLLDQSFEKLSLQVAKKLEEASSHPIARAIHSFCDNITAKDAHIVEPLEVSEVSGHGVRGSFKIPNFGENCSSPTTQCEAIIGNQAFLDSVNGKPDSSLGDLLSTYQSEGRSTAILAIKEASKPYFEPVMVFAISDSIRPEAYDVIHNLQSRGIAVYMCTGDNRTTANAVAAQLRIPDTNVQAGVFPTDKANFIKSIRNGDGSGRPKLTAFVGDGTNDSPALAASDVSIALASGSDIAVSTASFILLKSNLNAVLELCALSKRVFKRVKLNFAWAIVYNLCLVPVATGVFYPISTGHRTVGDEILDKHWRLNPVWASLAMALSSVSVVCSSLALRIEWRSIKAWSKRFIA